MDEPRLVCRGEAFRQLGREIEKLAQLQRAVGNQRRKRFSCQELHDDVVDGGRPTGEAGLTGVVDDDEVRMVQ